MAQTSALERCCSLRMIAANSTFRISLELGRRSVFGNAREAVCQPVKWIDFADFSLCALDAATNDGLVRRIAGAVVKCTAEGRSAQSRAAGELSTRERSV